MVILYFSKRGLYCVFGNSIFIILKIVLFILVTDFGEMEDLSLVIGYGVLFY